ncbi:hypothetical protein I3843_15G096200 [Carya illinoinensis]|nr:hypothetical protein I3843_15G096200 [Carya illinoinensis]
MNSRGRRNMEMALPSACFQVLTLLLIPSRKNCCTLTTTLNFNAIKEEPFKNASPRGHLHPSLPRRRMKCLSSSGSSPTLTKPH